MRQNELRDELQDAAQRRQTVMERMRSAPERALPGMEARLAELDARILSIEREISRNTVLLGRAPAEATVAAAQARPNPEAIVGRVLDDLVPLVAIVAVFVFAPIALSIARLFWRRGTNAVRSGAPPTDTATQQKLEHLQQAEDTIAIEEERISEGQRFVTRLLNEKTLPANGESVPARRP